MSGPPAPPNSARPGDDQQFLLGTLVASALIGFGLRRRNVFGTAAGIAGAGVLAMLVAPRIAPRLSSAAVQRRGVGIDTEFVVQKPRAAVFDFFHNFENFPLVGGIVESVEDFDDGRSRWRVSHRGAAVEWNVIVTKYLPPRVIGWESLPGAPVECSGTVRFDAIDESTTRVHLAMAYRPVSEDAVRAFVAILRQPRRRLTAALDHRIEAAMVRALEPDVHHREPAYPLPETPRSTAAAAPEATTPRPQP